MGSGLLRAGALWVRAWGPLACRGTARTEEGAGPGWACSNPKAELIGAALGISPPPPATTQHLWTLRDFWLGCLTGPEASAGPSQEALAACRDGSVLVVGDRPRETH